MDKAQTATLIYIGVALISFTLEHFHFIPVGATYYILAALGGHAVGTGTLNGNIPFAKKEKADNAGQSTN